MSHVSEREREVESNDVTRKLPGAEGAVQRNTIIENPNIFYHFSWFSFLISARVVRSIYYKWSGSRMLG